MSNHKVDISEVDKYLNDFKEASEEIRSNLDKVKEHIDSINNMESFSGKAAKEAKGYFNELHLTVLESFRGLFDDLEENLKQHLETFENEVDPSDSAIIESDYLKDVKEDINEVYEDLEKQDESIHDIIEDVAEITSATSPDFSYVDEWKKKSVKKIKELDEDLASFTNTGDETDVNEIMNQIKTVMNNAKTSEGKARFADFKGASDNSELKKLMNYNEGKHEETMEKAKDVKESTVKQLDETSSKDVVNKAYQDFKDGEIKYDEYIAILNGVKNTSGDISNWDEKTLKENADEEFIKYLEDRGMLNDYLREPEHKTIDQEKIEKLDDGTKNFLDEIDDSYKKGELSKEDYEQISAAIIEEGSKEPNIEKRQQAVLKVVNTIGDFAIDSSPAVAGKLTEMYGELLEKKHNLHLGPKLLKRMQGITGALKSSGTILTVAGGVLGYYDDVLNNDKTSGQAIAHNGAHIATSIGSGALIGGVAGFAVASGPAGWIGLGAAAVVGFTFNAAYNNNWGGLQEKLDWTGEKIDEGFDWAVDRYNDGRDWVGDKVDQAKDGMRVVGEGIKSGAKNVTDAAVDFADNVGDAVSGGLDAINPFS